MMARAATSGELVYLRSDNQRSKLYMAIIDPAVIFAAQINQSFSSTDEITSIVYDNVTTGAYTDIIAGMTLWVGSAAGLYDIGMARVKSATATSIGIARTSEIVWANDYYLSVVKEWGLWAKQAKVTGGVGYMDDNIAYDSQHNTFNPIVNMGPDAVLELSGATVNFTPTAAASWTLNGTVASYLWTAPGSSATADLNTATPTITYDTAGTYYVTCTATGSNGKTSLGYRTVYVWSTASPPITQFSVTSILGDWQEGGWAFSVDMYAEAARTTVRDRAKVILFADDWYGTTKTSFSPLNNAAYDHIVATGWIAGESIEWNNELSRVRFDVRGPQWWLNRLPSYAPGVRDVTTTPANWASINTLTCDKFYFHVIYWRSTIATIMDCYKTGDTRRTASMEASAGSLWAALTIPFDAKLAAHPCCNRYGQLYMQIDSQMLPLADRASIPVVMAVTKPDWMDSIEIERRTVPEVSSVEGGGFYWDGASYMPARSMAWGKVFSHFGRLETRNQNALTNKADAATWAGLYIGALNVPYPRISIKLASNNRLVDLCPHQYLTLSIATGDTPRGIVLSTQKIVVRTIQQEYNPGSGAITTDTVGESYSTPGTGVDLPIPDTPPNNTPDPPTPPYGDDPGDPNYGNDPNPPPPGEYGGGGGGGPTPPPPPAPDCKADDDAAANGPFNAYINGEIRSDDNVDLDNWMLCYVRKDTATNLTKVYVSGTWEYWDGDEWLPNLSMDGYTCEAIDASGTVLLTGTWGAVSDSGTGVRIATFAPAAATKINGWRVRVDDTGTFYQAGAIIESGSIPVNTAVGVDVSASLVNGNWYCIDSWNGPWDPGTHVLNYYQYVWKGIFGTNYASEATYTDVIAPYRRWFYQYESGAATRVTVADNPPGAFSDNTGTLSYTLRYASVSSVIRLHIDSVHVYNICQYV